MSRPYKDFVAKRVGNRIDYDGAYGYQCVDLIKQYADECLGMGRIGAIGNAKDVPDGYFGKQFEQIKGTNDIMQGDIIVKTNSRYGHIAIVDHVLGNKVYVLEQNGSGKDSGSGEGDNAIRVYPYNKSFYQMVLRNPAIENNYNIERDYVDEKIKEREQLLKDTKEYKESLYYKK